MLCHVVWGIDIFEKVTPGIAVEFEKHLCTQFPWDRGFHAKSVLFLNIFSDDLHFEALIIGFF